MPSGGAHEAQRVPETMGAMGAGRMCCPGRGIDGEQHCAGGMDSGRAEFLALRGIVYEKGSSIRLAGPKTVIISGAHLNEVRAAHLTEQGIGTFPTAFPG